MEDFSKCCGVERLRIYEETINGWGKGRRQVEGEKSKEEKGKYMKNEQRREQGQNDMEGKSRERLGGGENKEQ